MSFKDKIWTYALLRDFAFVILSVKKEKVKKNLMRNFLTIQCEIVKIIVYMLLGYETNLLFWKGVAMGNLVEFGRMFFSYGVLLLIFVAASGVAMAIGITLAKRKEAKAVTDAQEPKE